MGGPNQKEVFWHVQQAGSIPAPERWLHPGEQRIAAGFKFQKRKHDWLLGRWTAKQAVIAFIGKTQTPPSPNQIEIRKAPDGAPEVFIDNRPSSCILSLSHSHQFALCALAEKGIKLGCDLESVETRSEAFIKDYLTKSEYELIKSTNTPNRSTYTNLIWSAKESTMKATRKGLSVDTRSVEVNFSPSHDKKQWNRLATFDTNSNQAFFGFWRTQNDMVLTILTNLETFHLEALG